MNKNRWLKIVNPVLVISFLVQLSTIVTMLFGIRSKINFLVHKNNGLVLLTLVIIHLSLNWSWIKQNILKRRPTSGQ